MTHASSSGGGSGSGITRDKVRRLSVTLEVLIDGHRREVARYEALLGISTNGHLLEERNGHHDD